jgi:hypothetical protein
MYKPKLCVFHMSAKFCVLTLREEHEHTRKFFAFQNRFDLRGS